MPVQGIIMIIYKKYQYFALLVFLDHSYCIHVKVLATVYLCVFIHKTQTLLAALSQFADFLEEAVGHSKESSCFLLSSMCVDFKLRIKFYLASPSPS